MTILIKASRLTPFLLANSAMVMMSLSSAHAQHPIQDTCDTLAAHPSDYDKPDDIIGVYLEDIDINLAIDACRSAMKDNPHEPRYALNLGRAYEADSNYIQAAKHYKIAAEQNYVRAQINLGKMFSTGKGVTQSQTSALDMFSEASQNGGAIINHELGCMYSNGNDVPASKARAITWYLKAARQGYSDSQYNLGGMYANGSGVAQSDTQSFKWYYKAAEQGDPDAQHAVGWRYEDGLGVKQSYPKAVQWYRKKLPIKIMQMLRPV